MRLSPPRTIGCLMFVAALVLLVTSPATFSVVHMYGFLFCFVVGWLLLWRIIWPRFERFSDEPPPGLMNRPLVRVPSQTFRYPPAGPWVWLVFGFLSLTGLALAVLMVLAFRKQPIVDRILAPAPFLLFSVGLPAWLWRSRREVLKIDDIGVSLERWPRDVEIRWHEIVALRAYCLSASGIRTVYHQVHSPRATIKFTDKLTDSEHLPAQIAQATGLGWQ